MRRVYTKAPKYRSYSLYGHLNESATDRYIDNLIVNKLPNDLKPNANVSVEELSEAYPFLINARSLGVQETEFEKFKNLSLKDFYRIIICRKFEIQHNKGPKKYMRGIFRIVIDEFDYIDRPDDNMILSLKDDVMYIIQASNNGTDDVAKSLNGDFNGMSYNELHNTFKKRRRDSRKEVRNNVTASYSGGKSRYKVVPILVHDDAVKYSPYTEWCITDENPANYDNYIKGGRRFYIFLKDGYEDLDREQGPNCPMDEYGLSMISILVNCNGDIDIITTRWNHDYDGEYINPDEGLVKMFQNIINMKLYDVCKPYTREELHEMGVITFDDVEDMLSDGVDVDDIDFDYTDDAGEDYIRVMLNDKYNYVCPPTYRNLLLDEWCDDAEPFQEGFARISMGEYANWISASTKKYLSDQWFTNAGNFHEGMATVYVDDKGCNWVRADNGKFFSNVWYDDNTNFHEGFAKVYISGKGFNFVRADNGGYISDEWFESADNFCNGISLVNIKGKGYNWIRVNDMQYLSDEWFDKACRFWGGCARVKLKEKGYNWVDYNGDYISDIWFDECEMFFNRGIAEVYLKDKGYNYFRLSDKSFVFDEWYDDISEVDDNFISSKTLFKAVKNGKVVYLDNDGNKYSQNPKRTNESEINIFEEYNMNNMNNMDETPVAPQSVEGAVLEYIKYIEGVKVRLREMHWSAKNNHMHKLTDELIEKLDDYEDDIAEDFMGIIGIRIKVGDVIPASVEDTELTPLLNSIAEHTLNLAASIDGQIVYRGISSVLDEVLHEINVNRYLADMV